MNVARSVSLALLVAFASFTVAGCGGGPEVPDLVPVKGKLTNAGKPVQNAMITFEPLGQGRQSMASTDDDGNFEMQFSASVKGALPGTHKVYVAVGEGMEPELPDGVNAEEISQAQLDKLIEAARPAPVPTKYANGEFQIEVSKDVTVYDINMTEDNDA